MGLILLDPEKAGESIEGRVSLTRKRLIGGSSNSDEYLRR